MGRKRSKGRPASRIRQAVATPRAAEAAASEASPETVQQATPSKAAPARMVEKTLMETLDGDTTITQIVTLVFVVLAAPASIALVVKFAVLPLLFPNW